MRSPFAIFRKHQKLMTVILTGLAMFAFVILGAVNDPSNMPPALIVIFVACIFGSIGWVFGIRSKKSSECGFAGLIVGTVVSVGAMFAIGEPVRVKADTGDLNDRQLFSLQQQRRAANEYVQRAYQFAQAKSEGQFLQQPPLFGFNHPDPERDIIVGELLRREANELGIVVTDEMVDEYMLKVTQGRNDPDDVRAIFNAMNLGASDIYNILRSEIQARLTAEHLYGIAPLPPETYWDFYRQLNVRQSVSIVPIPVGEFVDESTEPSEGELQQLFDAHRENFPNISEQGRLEEGRPGFRQPRMVRLAYVEAAYDEIQTKVEPPTDEEIEAFYNEHYATLPADQLGTEPDGSSDAGRTESDGSGVPADGPALPAPDEELPSGRIDGEDLPPGEEEESPAPGEAEEGSFLRMPSHIGFVAVLDDNTAAETSDALAAPNADDSSEGAQPEFAASQAAPSESAGETSPSESPLESEAVDGPPPPPLAQPSDSGSAVPGIRELDDEFRKEIRDQLLRERTDNKMEEVISEADDFVRDLELRLVDLPDDPNFLTQDQALQELRAYAEEHGLVYTETPLLSAQELLNSEEYPIGSAVDRLFSDPFNPRPASTVVQQVFNAAPREVFRSKSAVQPETDSRFVYWKIEDQAEFVPESLADPGVREQVVATWRGLQARETAEARAAELAKRAEATDKPLSELFADETVTGEAETTAVSVLHPPMFSWMSKANPAMSPNPFNPTPPERTRLRSIPGRTGDSFMEVVFDDLKPGEAGVAHSLDKDYYYVIKVDDRSYGASPDMQAFRAGFMKEQLFAPYYISDYPFLAQNKLRAYQSDWGESLFKKHAVQIVDREQQPSPDEESAPPESSGY